MNALVLRLDAPLLSFGTVIIDQHGFIDRFPGTAMLCGLIGNALGWHHCHSDRLQGLQARIVYSARWDVPPQKTVDYHTADLGQPHLRGEGWTTRGRPEHRGGGPAAKLGIHQRYRHYWVDGLMTVVLGLTGEGDPTLSSVRAALERPARPLFIGRKACLPARPLLDPHTPVMTGEDVLAILTQVPVWDRFGAPATAASGREACWPAELSMSRRSTPRRIYDLRDWANQLPVGSRWRNEGLLGEGQE